MGEGFQFLDIILLAMIAGFIALRLRNVLGRRTGFERRSQANPPAQVERENEELIGQLQHALSEVKTLRGILPTCAYCKKIRDQGGHWRQIEAYVQENSHARFSHGICPDCINSHFEDYEQS